MGRRRNLRAAFGTGATIALLATMITPVWGGVTDNKTFTFGVTRSAPAGDADARMTLTLSNTSANQALGSANVTVPSPFVVTSAPADTILSTTQVLELRDLAIAPGGSRSFEVVVDVRSCVPGVSGLFGVVAKQSNAFSGTGNDFFLDEAGSVLSVDVDGTCVPAFVEQPADAERDATITGAPFDPQGDPITVEIRDASASPERATHSDATVELSATNPAVSAGPIVPGGTSSASAVAGIATFAPGPRLSTSAFDYRLVAAADFDGGGVDSTATSSSFDIVDAAVDCPAGQPCKGSAVAERQGQRVSATFGPGSTDATLVVTLGAADAPDFSCEGVSTAPLAAQFFTSDEVGDRMGQVTYRIPNASQPVKAYEICWAAPYDFTTDGGGTSSVQGTKPGGNVDLNVGVLPDCAKRGEPARPCVRDRIFDKSAAAVTVVIETDSRDPWIRG